MSTEDADRFVAEQGKVGALLDADPMPQSAAGLAAWVRDHPAIGNSPGMRDAVAFLRRPPLPFTVRLGYRVLFQGAVSTLPVRIRRALGLRRHPAAHLAAKAMIRFLRWSLGSSPSWNLALVRVEAPVPQGLFLQPLPTETLDAWNRGDQTGRSSPSR